MINFILIIIINYFSAQDGAPKGEMKFNYETDCRGSYGISGIWKSYIGDPVGDSIMVTFFFASGWVGPLADGG